MAGRTSGQFCWRMTPQHGGSFTRWRLSGSVPTALPGWEMRQVIRTLWFWSGWPVELVLPVAVETAPWLEQWCAAVAATPEDHLHMRLVARRGEGRNGQSSSK